MNQTNSIVIDGNLVNDGQFSEPKEGFKVFKMSVAVNRWYKTEDGTSVDKVSFFEAEAYGNVAEFCASHCKKGAPVRIVGRLQQDRWTNKEGKTDSKVYIVTEHFELLKRPGIETISTPNSAAEEKTAKAEEQAPAAETVTAEEAAVF